MPFETMRDKTTFDDDTGNKSMKKGFIELNLTRGNYVLPFTIYEIIISIYFTCQD